MGKNYNQNKIAENIKNILLVTFQALLVNYFILLILDSLMKGFVSYYINLQIYLWIVIFLAIICFFSRKIIPR